MLKNFDKSTYKESTNRKKRSSINDIIDVFDNLTFKKARMTSDDDNMTSDDDNMTSNDDNITIDKDMRQKIIDFSLFFNSDYKEKTQLKLFNKDGFDKHGYDINGYDKYGYDEDGLDIDGYYKDGFDKDGYDEHGYDKDGNNMAGYNKNYINMIEMLRTSYVEEKKYIENGGSREYDVNGISPYSNIKYYYFSKLHYNNDYNNINERWHCSNDDVDSWNKYDDADIDEDEYLEDYDEDKEYEKNIFRLMKARFAKDNEDDANDPDYVPNTHMPEEPYEDYVSDHDYS